MVVAPKPQQTPFTIIYFKSQCWSNIYAVCHGLSDISLKQIFWKFVPLISD